MGIFLGVKYLKLLRVTPAMEAGISDHVLEPDEIAEFIETNWSTAQNWNYDLHKVEASLRKQTDLGTVTQHVRRSEMYSHMGMEPVHYLL